MKNNKEYFLIEVDSSGMPVLYGPFNLDTAKKKARQFAQQNGVLQMIDNNFAIGQLYVHYLQPNHEQDVSGVFIVPNNGTKAVSNFPMNSKRSETP
jgi:hypothetical protein